MTDEEQSRILRDLRDHMDAQRKSDVGGSIAILREHMLKHDADNRERHTELRGDLRSISIRVAALETHSETIKVQDADEAKWWKRGILGAIGAALVGVVTWLAQRGIK